MNTQKIYEAVAGDSVMKKAGIRKQRTGHSVSKPKPCPQIGDVWEDVKARRFRQTVLDGVGNQTELKELSNGLGKKIKQMDSKREALRVDLRNQQQKLEELEKEKPWTAALFFIEEITPQEFSQHTEMIVQTKSEIADINAGLLGLEYLTSRAREALRAVDIKIRL